MSRHIPIERHIRAIAAVHGLVGAAGIAGGIAWLVAAAHPPHGPNDLSAVGIPIIAGIACGASVLFTVIAWMLWKFYRIAKWITSLTLASAAMVCSYTFSKYSIDRLLIDVKAPNGMDAYFIHDVRGALIEILTVVWSVLVVGALFRRNSREVFSRAYRNLIATETPIRLSFYSSPLFATGLAAWLLIGWAVLTL